MSDAIWGIIGVVIGTILGWVLNLLSNVWGKIDIVPTNCFCTFRSLTNNKNVLFNENPETVKIDLNLRVSNFKGKTVGLNGCEIELEYGDEAVKFIGLSYPDLGHNMGDNFEELINIPANCTKEVWYKNNTLFLPHPEKLRNGYKITMTYHINGKKKKYKKILLNYKPKENCVK